MASLQIKIWRIAFLLALVFSIGVIVVGIIVAFPSPQDVSTAKVIGLFVESENSQLIEIEPTSGITKEIVTLNVDTFSACSFATDSVNNHAFIQWSFAGEPQKQLHIVDLISGQIDSSITLGQFYASIDGYSADELIGLRQNDENSKVVSINLTTGITTEVATINVDSYRICGFTVDPFNHKAYVQWSVDNELLQRLHIVDLVSGQVDSSILLGEGYSEIEAYQDDELIGLIANGEQSKLVSINTTTGITSVVATVGIGGYGSGGLAVDAASQKAYIRSISSDGSEVQSLHIVDLTTAEIEVIILPSNYFYDIDIYRPTEFKQYFPLIFS